MADPGAATALPGAGAALAYLAGRLGTVAVVSGRPLAFLESQLAAAAGSPLVLAGLYGLERSGPRAGGLAERDRSFWRGRIEQAGKEAAGALPPGVRLEDKGIALALHFRQAPERQVVTEALAEALASRFGLELRPAKLAIELVPPVAIDKGTVTAELVADAEVACFLGDDAGDLAAFEALARHRSRGLKALCVAVAGEGTPTALLEAADLTLDGPAAALGLLAELAARLGWPGTST